MPYQPILATLGYVMAPNGRDVLLIHRNAREDDAHLGKYNGLGGKLDPGESIATGMARELEEEAGIRPTEMFLRGTISWPGFGKGGEDWFGFLFLITAYSGTVAPTSAEGALGWHPLPHVLDGRLPMWDGDRHFLPLVFDADPRPFHGVMPYGGGSPLSWTYERLPIGGCPTSA